MGGLDALARTVLLTGPTTSLYSVMARVEHTIKVLNILLSQRANLKLKGHFALDLAGK